MTAELRQVARENMAKPLARAAGSRATASEPAAATKARIDVATAGRGLVQSPFTTSAQFTTFHQAVM
jgi:hypothetical protein